MRRNLARMLWIACAVGVGLPGCKSTKTADTSPDIASRSADGDESVRPPAPARALSAESAALGEGVAAGAPARTRASGAVAMKRDAVRAPRAGTERYEDYGVNGMVAAAEDRLSTFAADVDTASYAIVRRKLVGGRIPPASAVRVEEFVNYFDYGYAGPSGDRPFAVHMDAAPSPFTDGRHLLRVGVQAKRLADDERKPANLVFLVDVSGSMRSADKLGLAKRALRVLVDNLEEGDTVSLVTYAGQTRVVLEPTGADHKARIMSALEELSAGGSTNMGSGLQLAYDRAARELRGDAVSRVIVLSDGDANVGNTSHGQILETIAGYVDEGVTLSTIGLGMGNYKDDTMEQLANKGNGNYYYIDSLSEAKKVFHTQLGGTLQVVAKDVKLQVEFDPDAVAHYRLIGYENREVADADFRNDEVDAGEIGTGHSVTALYELELTGASPRLATVRIRHKAPRGDRAAESSYPFEVGRLHGSLRESPESFRFATSVAAAAELLRKSPHAEGWQVDDISRIARGAGAKDRPERREFLALLDRVRPLENQLAIAH